MVKKLVVFMLCLAVFTTVLGISQSQNFFVVSTDVFNKVTSIVTPIYNGMHDILSPDSFDADQEIRV